MVAKKKKKSTVNKAGNYTKPALRERLFKRIKAESSMGKRRNLLVHIRRQVVDTNLEDRVAKEIREWSAYALEKPNENYNDFPACPFASKAWADNKVNIQFKYDGDPTSIYTTLAQYDDD